MYEKIFSKSHKCRDTFCPPLSSPMVEFTIEALEKILGAEQSVPIDTMLKAHNIIMT